MAYLGSWAIDDWLTFYSNTHQADTAAATDADAVPPYRIYEDETGAAILTGNMALLDAANTTGFYSERIQLTAANGLEVGKQYAVYISPTVNGVMGTISHTFQMLAEVNVSTISGDAAAADNLELDYDGTGYAKANSTIGTCTTNTDVRGTDNAALAATALTDATWTDARAGYLDELAPANLPTDIAAIPTAAENVNEWETQSQADPTGFHVNVLEVSGTPQTANDNGADINAILVDTTEIGVAGAGLTALGDARIANLDAAISTRTKPADTQARVTLVDTTTTNTDMRGTDNAALAATALSTATWTNARAGYLDNLNIGENVAGTSEIAALPTATENADGLLRRDWTAVAAPAARSVLNALRFLRNRWRILAGTLTVYEEDDVTSAWTGPVTTAAGNPVNEIDPT